MQEKNRFKQKVEKFFAGAGFYIVLILCVAVIGASAWVILNNTGALPNDDNTLGGDSTQLETDTTLTQEEPVISQRPDTQTPSEQPGDTSGDTPDSSTEPEDSAGDASAGTQTDADATDTDANQTGTDTPSDDGDASTESDTDEGEDADEDAQSTQAPEETLPTFLRPVNGAISFDYSVDALVYNKTMADWRTHNGVDFEAELGTKVTAAADGVVKAVGEDDLLGTMVVIEHAGGLCSIYANLASVPTVSVGDSVSAGDVIGSVGDTAIGESSEVTHLHFAMTRDGENVNPTDYLPQ